MSYLTLTLVGLALSADAFAVAVAKGLQMRRFALGEAVAVAAAFGFFQAAMPLLGWLTGARLTDAIAEYDQWVVAVLLAGVAGKMIHAALTGPDDGPGPAMNWRTVLVLALATSIDALAVGVGFAFLPVAILPAVAVIGAITVVVSFAGVVIGYRAGLRWRRPAEVVGGLVLLGIACHVLFEHLA